MGLPFILHAALSIKRKRMKRRSFKARIYNPSTRQHMILPAIEESDIIAEEGVICDIKYFMGHDPVNDQYKLLCTITDFSKDMQKIRSERWVFVLEAGGSWKRVAKDFHPHLPNPFELNMNGVLYYLGWTDMCTCVLVSFDFRSEEFSMIQVPRKPGTMLPRRRRCVTQIDHGGKVAVFDFTYLKRRGTVDLWVMQDWRKKEWLRKTLVLQPSQMHLVIWSDTYIVKGTTLQGKVILVPRKLVSPFYFLCYDLQTNDLTRVDIRGIPKRWFRKHESDIYCDIEFMNSSGSIKYLET